MHYTLRGKIAKAHPYQLDKTLTLEGAGAEAQAVGQAIDEVKKHFDQFENPHKVTAKQLGLGNVDNISDMDKPISTAQREAIDKAQTSADNAQTTADNAQNTADDAKTAAQNAQSTADTAQSTANTANSAAGNAQGRADDAYALASGKSSANSVNICLDKSKWSDNTQKITVEGLNATDAVFLRPTPLDGEEYFRCGIYGDLQGNGSITFKCTEVPTGSLYVHCVYITIGNTN